MIMQVPSKCPITDNTQAKLVYTYTSPPKGENSFMQDYEDQYLRCLWRFYPSNHYISVHSMNQYIDYEGSYVRAIYDNYEKLSQTFKKIISLPFDSSDNQARFLRIKKFSSTWFPSIATPSVLDIGSGLGVFPYLVKKAGWPCVAIDPDPTAISHIDKEIGVSTICGDFMSLEPVHLYDIVTLNKVLEHVQDPVKMLKITRNWLSDFGYVYIELPDGEIAFKEGGPHREEFFLEHLHIFSLSSTISLANKSGYLVNSIERVKEPSGKYTIRAFLSPEESKYKYL